MGIQYIKIYFIICIAVIYSHAAVWNSPHNSKKVKTDTLFSSFSLPPKRLDPVISYSANEWAIIGQIYEPPLQYNYLKRPYELEPLTLRKMPTIRYLNKDGKEVDGRSDEVLFTEYRLDLRKDIMYQDHPSFVKDANGSLLYAVLSEKELKHIDSLEDFKRTATRRLKASDYAYAIKRMAVRQNHSPILDSMQEYIVGLKAFSKKISKIAKEKKRGHQVLDLRPYSIAGVKVVDDDTLTIRIKGRYPQFLYWLSMNFFAPIPWEADLFYQQKGLIAKNLTLNWFPVGTVATYKTHLI